MALKTSLTSYLFGPEGYVNLWDIAAVSIIVEEAGGKVTDLDGKPIGRQTKTLLSTNRALHSQILKYF
ncbi:hypothetical protein COW99_05210 [Candidatus Roizmanbacteria bacterium CG22_combo_CG10-13_8_21_14_all_38_20]|uniref:Inositol monophosphatase n=1 Tax=Candidatus Roizmanbacteria bacterium CG22_combo_CG10-13_8_21_14_all_38_20 TaxID=1974862 RepID=A0A2H0BU11_9BACT|nr:hypothetical protein [Candidatus Microgenomates bacterium]PIP61163.1 MAG: hypothetical protein COW99_05210 [Candidatus Roizmanbacteria bacterium CG22_combo_CG10-13_8_21_14_all_38_20]PJC31153.1 MAG: hypothetical protein CO050_03875 [Candidatus Roizmanbacteria bacterium CG_4_9_14_0_2_um_filter_38_17]